MNIYSFASILASLFCLSLGSFVFIKRRKDKTCKIFGIASIITGIWTLFPFVLSIAGDDISALFFARIIYIPAIFSAPIWLHFGFAIAKDRYSKSEKGILILSYSISALFLIFSFNPLFIKGVQRFMPHFSFIPGPVFTFFITIFGLIFAHIIKTLFLTFKSAGDYKKNQLKIILLSCMFGFLSALLHFGGAYFNKELLPHDFFVIGHTGLIAYAILKYRLMDITITITRTGIFVAVYTLVLGIPFVITNWFKNWLVENFSANWWILPLGLMAALATVGPFVYIYLERKAERRLLYEQSRYQETLKQAAREMARIHSLKKLLSLIVHTVNKTVRISHSAIYLFAPKSEQFLLEAGRNLKKSQVVSINRETPLVTYLKQQREPMVLEEINRKTQENPEPILKEVEAQMRFLNAAVIVPGFLDERLIGILILGDKRSGKIYTTEDLNTFSLLANQAALAIENALLYENIEEQVRQRTKELVEVQKQLIQAEKLATVGTLAGGVAHEINNPLTAILTNVQMLLVSHPVDDKLDRESLELIEEATKRCRTIVQKLMAYAKKPLETAEISEVNLLNALKNVTSFLGYQLEQDSIKIVIDAKEDSYSVMGNQNELEQVVTNIILNARDAIKHVKKNGDIHISLAKNGKWIKMCVKDEGAGIPKEIMPKIFDPFFTTKEVGKGTGLGLSICQSIIEKHRGLITVQSEPGKGSIFTVQLPKIIRDRS